MKNIYITGALLLAASLSSCNDFLDIDPLDSFTNTPTYWSNPSNLQYQCNTFLNQFSGYGNSGGTGWFYYKYTSDDQVNADDVLWANTNVPASSSYWNQPYIEARRVGYIIKGANESGLDKEVVNNIIGIARLNRAWNYFTLVRMYGDVQWVDDVMEIDDEGQVYGARQNRDIVMDNVLEDLNFACANITDTRKDRFNKDMAYAMKSQICLWEGTYAKYRTQADNGQAADPARATKYLKECASACEYLMKRPYTLNTEYKTIYNSISLTNDPEVIFYKPYAFNGLMHSIIDYTMNTSGTYGITKDAFDNYLFLDGKPLASTTLDKSDAADANGSIAALLAVRDKRLAQTIDSEIACKGHAYSREGCAPYTSYTGYGINKYDNYDLSKEARNEIAKGYTDAPLFWLAVIYLDYAEAKAELGEFTADVYNNTIAKLNQRAGLNISFSDFTSLNDPANNMGVSSLIWEVRRARRCELMCDNWFRYWDLVRWHQLDLMDNTTHPNVFLGANVANVVWDKDEAGNPVHPVLTDGYIQANNGVNNREFTKAEARQYFYPVPAQQITLNPNLTQNPGW